MKHGGLIVHSLATHPVFCLLSFGCSSLPSYELLHTCKVYLLFFFLSCSLQASSYQGMCAAPCMAQWGLYQHFPSKGR